MIHIANKIIKELSLLDIKSYIWHEVTTKSIYIRFEDNRIGSIRLADHPGRNKLKYKFNVYFGKHKEGWVKDDDSWRYFVMSQNWKNIIPIIKKSY